uniref:NADH-ubiquinone oxidoreductase chain 5 n=1 Tax=Pediculus humanus capitis TaxID=121226 RepID=X2D1Z9_9NEOP|nr:NADH dehydrogenase subunit 5 [Pediculus humanus capitis]
MIYKNNLTFSVMLCGKALKIKYTYTPFFLLTLSLLIQFCFVLFYPFEGATVSIPLSFLSFSGVEVIIVLDSLSLTFLLMVLTISSLVMAYSNYYMAGHNLSGDFYVSMVLFIVSMLLLSLSGSMFWSFIGWDGLGMMSLVLILFNKSWSSQKSGVITFLMNRLGDSFMIICSSYLSVWGMCEVYWFWILSSLYMIGGASKSAQFPFSSWLPEAMAAPTPVSSLVHSSTLVTAGIYVLARYGSMIDSFYILTYLSSISIIVSGVSALWSSDLKKVVAYSTLSHISLMLFYLSEGSVEGALIHMLTHSVFKSQAFMTLGSAIYSLSSWQDSRYLSIYSSTFSMASLVKVFFCLSMAGLPFLSGGYSKEVLLILSLNSSTLKLFMFLTAVIFTSGYSFRIIYLLSKNINITQNIAVSSLFSSPLKLSQTLNVLISAWISSCPGYLTKLSSQSIALEGKIMMLFTILFGFILSRMSLAKFPLALNEISLSFASLPAYVWSMSKMIPLFFKMQKVGADGKLDAALSWLSQSKASTSSNVEWMMSVFTLTMPAIVFIISLNWLFLFY